MPKKHLKNELIKVFKSELRIKVKEKSKIYDFENWDSLSCEKRFKIKFNSREFSSLNSFKEIYKIVQKKA